ncbi:hypothetical protein L3Q82_010513 [Scortum barcoo]|uniref:Uncharacterized protein n=1 Tax=Scortum barcoo TaxID=214431 RepID=A0ACB8WC07_9TELE|nr:hypothetical protein L3Q82_010513 [Scortum barcoo]
MEKAVNQDKGGAIGRNGAVMMERYGETADMAGIVYIMRHQNTITEVPVKQQRLSSLPPLSISMFKGDPLEYKFFMCAFEHGIEDKTENCKDRLYFLEQFTMGKPRELVRSCQHMEQSRGYKEAKRLLKKYFGDDYKISTAHVDIALSWPSVKPEDAEALQAYSKKSGSRGEQHMADLPMDRVTPDHPPFINVGVDFFGPFEVKCGRKTVKRYGVIFACLNIRAVHLEVAYSLDTHSCINAIRRFIARRGQVKLMRSDNGTNLVRAEQELRDALKELDDVHIKDTLLKRGITWAFNPPQVPTMVAYGRDKSTQAAELVALTEACKFTAGKTAGRPVKVTQQAAHPPPTQPFEHLMMDFVELTPSEDTVQDSEF